MTSSHSSETRINSVKISIKKYFILILLLFPWVTHADDPVKDLIGEYRLVKGTSFNLDKTVMYEFLRGKLVIERLPNDKILLLRAETPKGHRTVGQVEVFKFKRNKFYYTSFDGYVYSRSLQYEIKDDRLIIQKEYLNGYSYFIWKKVSSKEKKNKYLERQISKQRHFYHKFWESNI